MKTWETWLSHISTIAVTVSGFAYLWMKYGIENNDPFSVVNHAWQPAMLNLHVLFAPLLVFVTGMIAYAHVQGKLKSGVRTNRLTGIVSMATLPIMIVSGYALQVVTAALLGQVILILHIGSSSVFAVTYVVHLVKSLRDKRSVAVPDAQAFTRRQTA